MNLRKTTLIKMLCILLYSGKLSREKTFANFKILWLYAKDFFAKFGVWHPLGLLQKRAIRESFLHENRIFTNLRKFSPICESFLPRKFLAILRYYENFPPKYLWRVQPTTPLLNINSSLRPSKLVVLGLPPPSSK